MPHIESMIDDYVLNLLSPGERSRVERHVASCPKCFGTLNTERKRISGLVATLKETSSPPAQRLERLWPAVASAAGLRKNLVIAPQRVRRQIHWRQAATGLALVVLIFMGLLGMAEQFDGWIFHIDAPATASHTVSPTVTLTPTWTRASSSPDSFALVHQDMTNDRPAPTGTPETLAELHAPEPLDNPPAPPAPIR